MWIPAGQWRQEQKILSVDPTRGLYNQKGIRNVTIRGAGMWRSQLYTLTEPQNVIGNINHPHEGNVGFDIDDGDPDLRPRHLRRHHRTAPTGATASTGASARTRAIRN